MLYKVWLADDERWILESLKGTLDWRSHGYEIIGESLNGLDAYDRMIENKPDVAFIDIRMPGINGLELIRRLHEEQTGIHCVVASGYAEFEYAKQAMNHGAVGYCLKPFKIDELSQTLSELKKRIDSVKHTLHNELLLLLHDKGPLPESEVASLLEQLHFTRDEDSKLFVVVTRGREIVSVPKDMKYVMLRIGANQIAYLILEADRSRILPNLRERMPDRADGIGISEPFTGLSQLRERIQQTAEASQLTGTDLDELPGHKAEKRGEDTLRRIEQFVRANFRDSLSVQDISRQFYLHPNYLSFLFKRELGVNFTKFVNGIRMEHACYLLKNSSQTVSEVAEQAGYNDYFYFARMFKRHTGLTPTEYRSNDSAGDK